MGIVRVKESVVVYDEESGLPTAIKENDPYPDDHPFVRAYPWAFASDVEQATAAPGERRNARR